MSYQLSITRALWESKRMKDARIPAGAVCGLINGRKLSEKCVFCYEIIAKRQEKGEFCLQELGKSSTFAVDLITLLNKGQRNID